LLDRPDVFGLATASTRAANFTRMSDHEPVLTEGAQLAMIEFGAEGFRAAAVSAVGFRAGSAPLQDQASILLVEVTHDRPFAVLVLDRGSSMVLFHGWVDPAATD
jgi:serine protease inhibitor